jgi:hypothetical protein
LASIMPEILPPGRMRNIEIIELSSEEDDDGEYDDAFGNALLSPSQFIDSFDWNDISPEEAQNNETIDGDRTQPIADLALSLDGSGAVYEVQEQPTARFTEADCLSKVLEIFPDICHNHVVTRFREGVANGLHPRLWCDDLIVEIIEAKIYPKEKDKKRKRAASDVEEEKDPEWDVDGRNDSFYHRVA